MKSSDGTYFGRYDMQEISTDQHTYNHTYNIHAAVSEYSAWTDPHDLACICNSPLSTADNASKEFHAAYIISPPRYQDQQTP